MSAQLISPTQHLPEPVMHLQLAHMQKMSMLYAMMSGTTGLSMHGVL